jgi:hypothetical protein
VTVIAISAMGVDRKSRIRLVTVANTMIFTASFLQYPTEPGIDTSPFQA